MQWLISQAEQQPGAVGGTLVSLAHTAVINSPCHLSLIGVAPPIPSQGEVACTGHQCLGLLGRGVGSCTEMEKDGRGGRAAGANFSQLCYFLVFAPVLSKLVGLFCAIFCIFANFE